MRNFPNRLFSRNAWLLLLAGAFACDSAWSQLGGGAAVTTEVFHVSRVGQNNAAESREQLIDFYREIETNFNAEAEREFREEANAFAGSRVRVIEELEEKESGKPLLLVAYQGQPAVFVVPDSISVTPGELTPPLEIAEAGDYTTEITRIHVEREEQRGGPALETVDTGGGASFFGIPIGGATAPAPAPPKKKGSKVKRTRVTEVKVLPKFEAVPSQVQLEKPPVFSKDLFLDRLKNGEFYSIERKEDRRCQNCGGFKRVMTDKPIGQRDSDGKMPCPECTGRGKILWDVTYRVTW